MRFAATGPIIFGVLFNIALGHLEHLSYSDGGLGRQINLYHVHLVASVEYPRSHPWRNPRILSIRD